MGTHVGDRLRKLRVAQGLSQLRLAEGLPISPSYISLIEAGRRMPSRGVAEALAARLGCAADYLLTGRGGPQSGDLDLELRFAELALRNGEVKVARERFDRVLSQARESGHHHEETEALWGRARADELLGRAVEAAEGFLALLDDTDLSPAVSRAKVQTELAHVYIETGDLDRAMHLGEEAIAGYQAGPGNLVHPDEVLQLAATVVWCYYERGDLLKASILIRRVISDAERAGSPKARASAYWNAALVAEARGELRSARGYADRALALFGEADDARSVALLRLIQGWLMAQDPAEDHRATAILLREVIEALHEVASPVEVACAETELARCHLSLGEADIALEIAVCALDRLGPGQHIEAARARTVLGQARFAMGDYATAAADMTVAAADLERSGATRHATKAWRELADAMAALGLSDQAMTAYRRMADSAGTRGPILPPRTPALPAPAATERLEQ